MWIDSFDIPITFSSVDSGFKRNNLTVKSAGRIGRFIKVGNLMLLFYLLPTVAGFIQVSLGRPTFQLRKRRLAVEQSFLRWGCLDQQHIWIWCGWFSDVRNAFRIPCCILSESTKTSVAPYLFNQLINSLAVNIWEEEVQFAPGKKWWKYWEMKQSIHTWNYQWKEIERCQPVICSPLAEAAGFGLADKPGPLWAAASEEC